MAAQELPADGRSDLRRAIEVARDASRGDPTDRQLWSDLTDLLANAGQWVDTVAEARRGTVLFDDWAEPWFRLSVAYEALGDLTESLLAATEAVRKDQNHLGAQSVLGLRRVEIGERLDGMERVLATSQLSQHPFVLVRRARAHILAGQPEEAEYWLKRILGAAPDSDEARGLLAHLYERTGRLDDAAEAIEKIPERQGVALLTEATILRRAGRYEDALSLLDPGRPGASTLDRGLADVERGRSLEKAGRIDEAWDAFSSANEIARSRSAFGADGLEWFEALEAWWRRQPADRPRPNTPSAPRTPIAFLVGVPRSGTTLVEQIITATSVASTTECSAMAVASAELATATKTDYPAALDHLGAAGIDVLRSAYWEALARWLVPDDVEVLDKLPLNLLYLGSIDAAFPETRVIMVRRDPRDVVLSLYLQQFTDNALMVLTTTLESAAQLYIAAMRLWAAAQSKLRLPVLEIRYEDLVGSPVEEIARLAAFLDLDLSAPEDSGVARLIQTPSYEAAGRSVHAAAVGRWKDYEHHLQPVLAELQPWVEAHETFST